ncbi:bis(5'-nucleosyl)-tetraphosphatase [asymmetrical]-like [Crassostrea angulata]|uniref:Bis(5'-nucleosyl)-tetraphosphatase [asymmetrical] n=1 Tax=Magallana gigas TaxID=29159 RepID=K1QKT4_MAGGI|nr:bis(5'-nucleosyl)-tetraphosphatase [asymmetrical] [Crassostrea gigas]XP_052717054.1 bis(5'-nucleosyl)-tetraphosphatase [asymmetrical]-like [Crassostrea angulata]|eukprot:XP_011452091.1 PREDICTED: bis(5'-nucleosyl)-tetraphosphatase [asymmetrical] [Crassostrea gigas]
MNPKQKVAAGFLVFRRLGKEIQYLLLQTSYGENHWSPPKGHVDPGETELQTALRETEEEAGLKESDFTMYTEFQRTLNYEVQGKPKRVVYWLSELKNPSTPVTLSDEHIDFKWLNLPQALNYVEKYKDFQQVLNDADTFIKSNL